MRPVVAETAAASLTAFLSSAILSAYLAHLIGLAIAPFAVLSAWSSSPSTAARRAGEGVRANRDVQLSIGDRRGHEGHHVSS
jgi:hypothetical protein